MAAAADGYATDAGRVQRGLTACVADLDAAIFVPSTAYRVREGSERSTVFIASSLFVFPRRWPPQCSGIADGTPRSTSPALLMIRHRQSGCPGVATAVTCTGMSSEPMT